MLDVKQVVFFCIRIAVAVSLGGIYDAQFYLQLPKLRKEPSMDAVPYAGVKNISTCPEVLNVRD